MEVSTRAHNWKVDWALETLTKETKETKEAKETKKPKPVKHKLKVKSDTYYTERYELIN